MESETTIIGVYDTHIKALKALEALKIAGLPVRCISFISKADVVEGKLHGLSNDEKSNVPVEIGAVFGPVLGILSGLSIVTIPGLGFIYGAGAIVGAFAGFDLGIIVGGLSSVFLSFKLGNKASKMYEKHLEEGKYIITIIGDERTVSKAKEVLHTVGLHIELQHHQ